MKIENPEDYCGLKVKIISPDGTETVGIFDGYSYDYDDEENEMLEIDIEQNGIFYSISEDEIQSMELIS